MRTLFFLALGFLLLLGVARPALRSIVPLFVFHPEPLRPQESDPRFWGLRDVEEVYFESDGLRLHAWWIPVEAGVERCGSAIYLHGNAGHLAQRGEIAANFARLGLDVLLFDYRGYGLSEGRPTEEGLYRDADAAYMYLTETLSVEHDDIMVIGNSLGSAVAVDLAVRRPVAGLVLLGALTSTVEVARRAYGWLPDWLLDWETPRFDALERAPRIEVPVLMAAGSKDRVVPQAESRRVFDAIDAPKAWYSIEGADHGELFGDEGLWRVLHAFTRRVLRCEDRRSETAE